MFRNALSLTLVPALVFIAPSLRAQTPALTPDQIAKVDAKLSKWYPANQPGAAVLLMKDGQVVFKKGYGLANVKLNSPIQPDMAFRIGSVTKQFTAAAIMKLVEDGKIDLQAPISGYLEKLPEAWKTITVEQLLTHTSGLPNFTNFEAFWEKNDKRLKPARLLEDYVCKLPLDFEPGTQYRYSNTGYILLGMLIEKTSGQNYPEFLQKRLLDPLQLSHTRYDSDTESIPDLPSGYRRGSSLATSWSVTQKFSAGGLVSTAADLARWTQALHDGKVVKPESLARMLTPVRLKNGKEESYGFGLGFRQSQGHRLVGHDGQVNGFQSNVEADPEARAVAVILSNTTESKGDSEYFTRYLLALAAGHPLPEPQPAVIEPSKLRRLTGLYTLGSQIRTISLDEGRLFSRLEGNPKFALIPLSETEFHFEDSDRNVRFELAGDKVIGLHRRFLDSPESPLHKRMEPLPDQDPKVTELVQRSLHDLVEGTLKPEVFTRKLAKQIFPDTVKEMANDLKALGKQTGLDLYKREEGKNGLCMYLYRVGFGEKNIALYLWMNKDLQVADFDSVLE